MAAAVPERVCYGNDDTNPVLTFLRYRLPVEPNDSICDCMPGWIARNCIPGKFNAFEAYGSNGSLPEWYRRFLDLLSTGTVESAVTYRGDWWLELSLPVGDSSKELYLSCPSIRSEVARWLHTLRLELTEEEVTWLAAFAGLHDASPMESSGVFTLVDMCCPLQGNSWCAVPVSNEVWRDWHRGMGFYKTPGAQVAICNRNREIGWLDLTSAKVNRALPSLADFVSAYTSFIKSNPTGVFDYRATGAG